MRVFVGYLWAVTGATLCYPVSLIVGDALGGHLSYLANAHTWGWGDAIGFARTIVLIWVAIFIVSALPFTTTLLISKAFGFRSLFYCLLSGLLVIEGLGALGFFIFGSIMGEGMSRPTFIESFSFWLFLLPIGLVSGFVFWVTAVKTIRVGRSA